MFKMLLASTALTALVATSAFAQTAPATTDTNPAATTEMNATTDTNVMTDAAGDMHGPTLATDLIGANVYESSAMDASSIGKINDIVVSPEGEVSSVIIGVGGFLGIGQKDVEVEYSAVSWADRDGQRWIVANMTREQLEAAPAFDRTHVYTEAQSQPEGMNATQNTMTGTAPAPATGTDPNVATGTGTGAVAPAEQQTQVIDRMTMTQVTPTDITADDLTGRTVYGSNNENIGEVGEVLISTDNQIEGFVLNVGGFLGMGVKEVAISPENLDIRADADGGLTVFTPFTKEQLEAQPEYSQESWNADRDSVIM
ncbi:MAG: PRC-barrel domain-containing protein, partial [Hoeflea sp.]|nr:PRC-barrel domain-containing protein [Hoeflea sp.]